MESWLSFVGILALCLVGILAPEALFLFYNIVEVDAVRTISLLTWCWYRKRLNACQPVGSFEPSLLSAGIISESCDRKYVISNLLSSVRTYDRGLFNTNGF